MFVLTATIRPGLHGTFTLEFLTVDMTEPTVFTGFISVEEAQLKMVELFANANVDVSKVKQKPVKYFTTKTRYGTVEIWMRANGKKKYLKVVENETQAQLFIKGKAVVEQSINVDLQRNVTQLQQENERLRLELENVLNKIPQKRSVNHGDLLATQTFGVCPKCQEPFVVRHLPSGLPFKGCSTYERGVEGTCKGTQAFTEDECRRLKFDEAEIQMVIEDQKRGKKQSKNSLQNTKPFDPDWDVRR